MVELQQFRCGRRFCLAGNEKAFKAAGEAVIEVEVRADMVVRVHSLDSLPHFYFLNFSHHSHSIVTQDLNLLNSMD